MPKPAPRWRLDRRFKALLLLLIVVAIIAAVFLAREVNKYRVGSGRYEDIAQAVLPMRATDLPSQASTSIPPTAPPVPGQTATPAPTPGPTLSPQELELRQIEAILPVDFNRLHSINPNAVGWIYNQGTTLDYPVVQGDDNEYYLTHMIDGTPNKLGSIFMDQRNKPDFSDDVTVIYGHNMEDGSMFTSLEKYKQQAFFDQHPRIYLRTPGGIMRLELFSGMLIRPEEFDEFKRNFDSADEKLSAIRDFKERSTFKTTLTPDPSDRLLTLVTCVYDFPGARFIVIGRLVPLSL